MSNPFPLITVVTVCFNAVTEIEKTIRSVLAQTYPHIEYIIIDGGSTDGTKQVIEKYADRIDRFVSEPDKGIFDAMNKGISMATGEYVNFMNAGDTFFEPESIMKVMKASARQADFIAASSYLSSSGRQPLVWEPVRAGFTYSDVIKGGACNHQSCFIRRSVLGEGYPLEYGVLGDLLLFIDKTVYGRATYEPVFVPAVIYDANGVSSDPALRDKRRAILDNYRKAHAETPVNPDRLDRSAFDNRFATRLRNIKRRYYRLRYYFDWNNRREF